VPAWLTAAALCVATAGCSRSAEPPQAPDVTGGAAAAGGAQRESEPIRTIRPPSGLDARRVALGRRLFSDRRLSSDGGVSCASCHDLARAGVDGRRVAVGVRGAQGLINTPTVWNADLNARMFWDGRADSLEDQIDGPIHSAREMASSWPHVLAALAGDPGYVSGFARAYPDGLNTRNVKDAIASFERTLVTTDSPFDRYLGGAADALSADELAGYALFKSYGCVSCHQGRNAGGNLFEPLGLFGDYFADRGGPVTEGDLGRYNVTRRPEDRFKFRVPPLRLVAETAPYFHDGQVATLGQAIQLMGKYQLGQDIPAADVERIARFLAALAGRRPGHEASRAVR
jgi:cytochrome c peroxidase